MSTSQERLRAFFGSVLLDVVYARLAPAVMRVAISGSASMLAFVGLHQLYRQG